MNKKLTFGDMLGYSMSGVGEGTSYTLASTFLLFFLTTIAGISPAVAGTMIAFATVWTALLNPVAGYLSDNCRSRLGKRRAFMMMGTLPLAVSISLMFTSINAGVGFKICFYMIMILAFWTCYSLFYVPYITLGAEYTDDYNERTRIRTFVSFTNSSGGIIGGVLPTMIVDIMTSRGAALTGAWLAAGITCGVIAGATIAIGVISAKGKDKPVSEDIPKEKPSVKKMFKAYGEVLKLNPLRWAIIASISALIGLTIVMSDRVYFLTYNFGLSGKMISLVMFLMTAFGFCAPPIVDFLCRKFDKRTTFIALLVISSSIYAIYQLFLEGDSLVLLLVIFFIGAIGTMTYWQLLPALLYDVIDYDEYVNGQSRGGTIVSVQSLAEAVSSAIAMWLLGFILEFAGFDGAATVQTETALSWINNCMFIVPALFLLFSAYCIFKFPITRKKYMEIQEALKERRSEADETGLN